MDTDATFNTEPTPAAVTVGHAGWSDYASGGYVPAYLVPPNVLMSGGCHTITTTPDDPFKLNALEVKTLRGIQEKLYNAAKVAGWHDKPRTPGEGIALIHSEVSEALEGFRKDLMDDHLTHRKMAEVEFADAIIRILDEAGLRGFDVAGAMAEKFEYNQKREDHKPENRAKAGGKKF